MFPVTLICFFAFLSGILPNVSPAAPVPVDIQSYRTTVSPGTVEEDLVILREIIPELARRMFPASPKAGHSPPDTLDLRLSHVPQQNPEMNGGPGVGLQSSSRLLVNGTRYLQASETYLQWRKEYETKWIQADVPSWEPKAASRTPLQRIFADSALDPREKATAMLKVYYKNPMVRNPVGASTIKPTPTPPPEFWPISDVIEMPEVKGSVQFNLRGHKVIVLDEDTGEASVIPYYSTQDPRAWLTSFRRQALRHGLARAVKIEQERESEVSKSRTLKDRTARKAPLVSPPPESVPTKPEEKPKPQIPWGE